MITRFLTARHWQLFTLIFGLALFFQMMLFIAMFATSSSSSGTMDTLLSFSFILLPLAPLLMMGGLLGWLYSVGSRLQKQVPAELRRPTSLFKVALVFPTVYLILIIAIVFPLLGVMATSIIGGDFILIIIFALHLFAIFCVFYCVYFSARAIKEAELKRPTSFADFAGEFFLIWFFPVGIWFLQPRINELVKTEATSPASEDYV